MKQLSEKRIRELAITAAKSNCENFGQFFLGLVRDDIKEIHKIDPVLKGNIHGEVWYSFTLETEDGEVIDAVSVGKTIGDTPDVSLEEARRIGAEGVGLITLTPEETERLYWLLVLYISIDIETFNGHEVRGWFCMDVKDTSGVPEWDKKAREVYDENMGLDY